LGKQLISHDVSKSVNLDKKFVGFKSQNALKKIGNPDLTQKENEMQK
jgi:hypothetical protein